MLRVGGAAHLAITPDGPRGPRRQVQQGLVYLAARTGMAIVPVGIAFSKAWRMRSWDCFAMPKPWSSAVCVTCEPIEVPGDTDRAQLITYTERVVNAMQHVGELAERWAASGRWDAQTTLRRHDEVLVSINGRG
jgi:lysophospholipid acyltransferase (LPLAT)-like uncharacterized protein